MRKLWTSVTGSAVVAGMFYLGQGHKGEVSNVIVPDKQDVPIVENSSDTKSQVKKTPPTDTVSLQKSNDVSSPSVNESIPNTNERSESSSNDNDNGVSAPLEGVKRINWDALEVEAGMEDEGYTNTHVKGNSRVVGEIPSNMISEMVPGAVGLGVENTTNACLGNVLTQEALKNLGNGGVNKTSRAFLTSAMKTILVLESQSETYTEKLSVTNLRGLSDVDIVVHDVLSFLPNEFEQGEVSILFAARVKIKNGEAYTRISEVYYPKSEAETAQYLGLGNNINVYNKAKRDFSNLGRSLAACIPNSEEYNVDYVDDGNFLEGPLF